MNAPLHGTPDTLTPAAWAGEASVLSQVAEIAGLPKRRWDEGCAPSAARDAPMRVRYVEDKHIDWDRVRDITALSERAGHWANFGPVSAALERVLECVLGLPSDRAVVMCASATVGLQALAGLEAVRRGRKLRWVVSAYTFFAQRVGPFSDSIVVDCGHDGIIDMDAVAALPDETWDGVVVTNLFAGLPSARPFAELASARGKAILLDSAAALFGPDRTWTGHPNEAASFHHTKPWGVGEGGCIIVDRDDATLARSLLNFGIGAPPAVKPFAGNGKISDVACAVILERLERLPSWARPYDAQRTRIETLCHRMGVPLLLQAPRGAIVGSVPALAAQPVERQELAGMDFDVGKYYPPLADHCPRARAIFARMINIPSHAGMAAVDAQALARALTPLMAREPERC
jgi:dTDP-4-amino-4,6-dideoxygalactose transaminase